MMIPSDKRAVVVVPARGGSEGIPRKNLAKVGGIPLVVIAIRAAHRAKRAGFIVVSTDDDEIAETASREGAFVIRRPSNLATSIASSEGVVCHALNFLESEGIQLPAITLLVQCTSPFINGDDIDSVVENLESEDADSCLTVSETHAFLWEQDDSLTAKSINHDSTARLPRQQMTPQFVETGAVYGFKTAGFLRAQSRFFGKTVLAIVDSRRTLEIDEPFDLALARKWQQALESDSPSVKLPHGIRAIVFDFDGVMTDNRALVTDDGHEAVFVDRSDGLGLSRLQMESDAKLLVLSTEKNNVVRERCKKLGIECKSGIRDKVSVLENWLLELGVSSEECVYIGNDANDRECMDLVGYSVAPADAVTEIKQTADLVLRSAGGHGAVRELVDLLFECNALSKLNTGG